MPIMSKIYAGAQGGEEGVPPNFNPSGGSSSTGGPTVSDFDVD